MPVNVPHLLMALGSFVAGVRSLQTAVEDSVPPRKRKAPGLSRLELTDAIQNGNGQPSANIYRVNTIEERLAGVAAQMMKSVRDPRVRQLAVSIVSKRCREPDMKNGDGGWCLGERDYWGEVKALFYWMRANVRYIRDMRTIDTFATAMRTIEARGGDCDDYTIALGSLLMSIGYPVRMKTIQTKGAGDWSHIYLQVGLPPGNPTRWRTLDASVSQPAGWEAPASMIVKARTDAPEDPKWSKYL